ncbi:MAG: YigZ family protein [Candidatus Kapabacteria bacterium]|nr:YigZ family protein [Candidatus Kapabacteria bacterium]
MTFPAYNSILREAAGEVTIKRSVFFAYVAPCKTKDEAIAFLENIRVQHWDAVHHCFAWRIGPHGMEYRMSDDGEPSGTAGKPLLFALQRANLSDVIIVVARYFGGVKLGVGPLSRAYSEAANIAIRGIELLIVRPMSYITVHCTYDDVSTITRTLEEAGATFTPNYGDAIAFDVCVPEENLEQLVEAIISRTNARAGYSKVTTE